MRGSTLVVEDLLVSDDHLVIDEVVGSARVHVAVMFREPAACNLDPDAVAGQEAAPSGVGIEAEFVNLARFK